MRRAVRVLLAAFLACLPLSFGASETNRVAEASDRSLTFEERVEAQEAIERVYYSHQIGVTRPFEEAVPREVLEKKVRTYLKQSLDLAELWDTPITAERLLEEWRRIANTSSLPERLREIYAALGHDSRPPDIGQPFLSL